MAYPCEYWQRESRYSFCQIIIIEAIKAGNTTRATILAYIKTVAYVGVGGQTISFDANGDSTLGFINGFEVKAGKVFSTGDVK